MFQRDKIKECICHYSALYDRIRHNYQFGTQTQVKTQTNLKEYKDLPPVGFQLMIGGALLHKLANSKHRHKIARLQIFYKSIYNLTAL